MSALFPRLRNGKPWRAWRRYSEARGNVLAAGVGYFAFFSVFPAVALSFSVFGFFLRGHTELLGSITDQLNQYLPGFVQDAQHPNGLIPVQTPDAGVLTITGVLAFVTLVLAGLGWLGAAREGVRAVFGVKGSGGNLITNKVRDLSLLFSLGLGIALSAVLTTTVGAAASWIADRISMSGQGWILALSGLVVGVVADTALMMVLLRVLSRVPSQWRDLRQGALVGGVGFGLLKLSAATLLPRVTDNPLFASIAIVVGLLFWLNLIARLTLFSAAWAANDVDDINAGQGDPRRLLSPEVGEGHAETG
ncbi:MAG: YihY/virulence factor BrkB family protein [Actinomycetota bacterium]